MSSSRSCFRSSVPSQKANRAPSLTPVPAVVGCRDRPCAHLDIAVQRRRTRGETDPWLICLYLSTVAKSKLRLPSRECRHQAVVERFDGVTMEREPSPVFVPQSPASGDSKSRRHSFGLLVNGHTVATCPWGSSAVSNQSHKYLSLAAFELDTWARSIVNLRKQGTYLPTSSVLTYLPPGCHTGSATVHATPYQHFSHHCHGTATRPQEGHLKYKSLDITVLIRPPKYSVRAK